MCIRSPCDLAQLEWFQIMVPSLPWLQHDESTGHLCTCAGGAAPGAGGIKDGAIMAPSAFGLLVAYFEWIFVPLQGRL